MLTRSLEFLQLIECARTKPESTRDPDFQGLVRFVKESPDDIEKITYFFAIAEEMLKIHSGGREGVFDLSFVFKDNAVGITIDFVPPSLHKKVPTQQLGSLAPGYVMLAFDPMNATDSQAAGEARRLTTPESIRTIATESVHRFIARAAA